MATLVSPMLRAVALAVVNRCGLASAVLSGIAPDPRHLEGGGYHCSVEDLRKHGNQNDYSNTRVDDKDFNVRYGAALDVTMSTADMVRAYKRVYAVWKDSNDPRRKYINAVNCWDGTGDAVRLDFKAGKAKYASPDHKWHVHGDMPRRYVLDPRAARAWISMFAGESRTAWAAREEKPAAVKPSVPAPTGKAPVPARPATRPAPKVFKPGSRELSYVPGKKVLRGEDVRYVQRFIGTKWMGSADGVAGAQFRSGVKKYQAMRGLTADGVLGRNTWKSLGVRATF